MRLRRHREGRGATPYGQDPTGQTWIYSRARFFTTPDGQVWSEIGSAPWWIQTTDGSNRYWWWSGSMWQGPFQPNQAYTTSEYEGQNGTNYVAVVTEAWLLTNQMTGPYNNLERASGQFAMLDPNWACQLSLITF